MHFTIERTRLLALADGARLCSTGGRLRGGKVFLWACATRVFLKVNSTVAGEEALVLRDGGCRMLLADLLDLLKLDARRTNFTVEADANGMQIAKVPVRCWDYTDRVSPPGVFAVGSVVDLHVAGAAGGSNPPARCALP